MKTDELRKKYLDFFKSKDHRVFSSDSLVPADDPSLLFTGAGMNQFKPYFLGQKKDVKRAVSCQKCLRTADLDRVGKTPYHHTFFEMLGNFSFGDYFKEEAIAWGWEFVTKELKLPPSKLWVSVYQEDDEAFNIWKTKIALPDSRIVRMGPEDNFWPANAPKDGPNGPCGPCSEIYVGEIPGKGVEIWNLVFTQFDRQSDGSLKNLPQRNIDTGMGLERTAAVLQGVESNFDTDNFQKIRAELKKLLKSGSKETAHENAVMDYVRAVVFSIADGALPSNEGRGYVIRKLIRLASDHLTKAGAAQSGTLARLVPAIGQVYGKAYPEIVDRQKTAASIVENEEKSFLEVLTVQIPKLNAEFEQIKKAGILPDSPAGKVDPAKIAFMYHDTYGVPLELTEARAATYGFIVDRGHFNQMLEQQRSRSRENSKIAGEIFSKDNKLVLIEGLPATKFLGYEKTEATGKLLKSAEPLLIFDQTPFYAESGGQIGDTGEILGKNFKAKVLDTQFIDKCVAHKVQILEGQSKEGETYTLKVDAERRADIMKNHTATHLLHAALRKVLGDHVKQSGSLVAPDRLRFDFTHFSALDPKAMAAVEALVNTEIHKNITLDKKVMSKEKAVEAGAIAFFGEKYGDEVRVVSVGDFSKELCGGTHLRSTGEIRTFKIISEGSIQAGVRRIEAVTGRGAKSFLENAEKEIKLLADEFDSEPGNLSQIIKNKKSKLDILNSELDKIINKLLEKENQTEKYNGVSIITRFNDKVRLDVFSLSIDYLKTLHMPFVALLEGSSGDKVFFAIGASQDLVQKGFHAGRLVKIVSEMVGGNGGGRPDYAVGGGKNSSKAKEAFELGKKIIKDELNTLSVENKK